MSTVTVSYAQVPAQVVHISAYSWQQGSAPVPLPITTSRDGEKALVAFAVSGAVVVSLEREDGAYVLDGPFVPRAADEAHELDEVWRHDATGAAADESEAAMPLAWIGASGATGGAWPSCWWKTNRQWRCMGVAPDVAGVVTAGAEGALAWAVVRRDTFSVLRRARWGRLLQVTDSGGVPPRLRVTPAHAVVPAQRGRSVRLETSLLSDARTETLAPGVFWVAGDSAPPDGWVEVRSGRSGAAYVPLEEIAGGPSALPVRVWLSDMRQVAVSVLSDSGAPAAGALVTAFRLLDGSAMPRRSGDAPPRRVLAFDTSAAADGNAMVDGLGAVEYEIVAWHPQFGRGTLRLRPDAAQVTIRLHSPGIVRGRVLVGGKPASGVDVLSVPDPGAYMAAEDPIDVKGGDARSGADGRFALPLSAAGGGELRIGGGAYAVVRVPLPRPAVPLVDVGDIEVGRGVTVSIVLDQDPGCDVRAAGPIGRSGLQIVTATRTGPGLFSIVLPEAGAWEFGLLCGRDERALAPGVANVAERGGLQELRFTVR